MRDSSSGAGDGTRAVLCGVSPEVLSGEGEGDTSGDVVVRGEVVGSGSAKAIPMGARLIRTANKMHRTNVFI